MYLVLLVLQGFCKIQSSVEINTFYRKLGQILKNITFLHNLLIFFKNLVLCYCFKTKTMLQDQNFNSSL